MNEMRHFYLFFFLLLLSFTTTMAQEVVITPSSLVPEECTARLERTTGDGANNFDRDNYRSCLSANVYNNNTFVGRDDIYRLSDRYDYNKAVTIKMKATSNARDLDLFIMNGNTCVHKSILPADQEDVINVASWNSSWRIVVDGYNSSQNGAYVIEAIATCRTAEPPRSFPCELSARTIICNSSVSGDTRTESDNIRLDAYTGGSCLNFTPSQEAANPFTGNDVVYRLSGVDDGTPVTLRLDASTDLDMFIYRCFDGIGTECISAAGATSASSERVTINWDNNYIIIIDSPTPSQNGRYSLSVSCTAPCSNTVDENCDDIVFDYKGNNGDLTYEFSVPSLPSNGSWTATRNETQFSLGSGSRRTYTFTTPGEYLICYRYTDNEGCLRTCCKTIYITNPFDCGEITSNQNGNNYNLSLNGIDRANIIKWVDDRTGNVLNTTNNQITVPVPVPEDCRYYSVTYYDPVTRCFRICCIEVCGTPCTTPTNHITAGNQVCDFVDYKYNRAIGGLSYQLSVPTDLPNNGRWEIVEENGNIIFAGTGRTRDFSFPYEGRFLVCYKYRDSNGCDLFCCRWIYINNPFECDEIIFTQSGNNYVLSLGGTVDGDILQWTDDATGNVINTSRNQVTVPVPDPDECRYYSVTYYDPFCDCYRICCIKVCGPTGDGDCCPNGDVNLSKLIDLYKNICECGASIYCYDGNGFSGYFVYTGFFCCSEGTGTVFDCQGNIRDIWTISSSPFFNNSIGDLVWDGCNSNVAITTEETTPLFLNDYPWLSDIVDFNNCTATSIEIHQASPNNFVYVVTPSSSSLYNSSGAIWCTSDNEFNCLDFYSDGLLDSWSCGSNLTSDPCVVNPEDCNTQRIVLPSTQKNAPNDAINIYPNPSQGTLFINFSTEDLIKTIKVFDVSGKLTDTFNTVEKGASGQIELDLSAYTSGMYLLQMESENKSITKRIVVE